MMLLVVLLLYNVSLVLSRRLQIAVVFPTDIDDLASRCRHRRGGRHARVPCDGDGRNPRVPCDDEGYGREGFSSSGRIA